MIINIYKYGIPSNLVKLKQYELTSPITAEQLILFYIIVYTAYTNVIYYIIFIYINNGIS